jgi:hypothetical protein
MSGQINRNFYFNLIDVSRNYDSLGFNKKPDIILPFTPTSLMISNESNDKTLYFSFNGSSLDGILFKKETPITFDHGAWTKLHFAKEAGDPPIKVRVWAWRR